jgi:hypothetical protein
MQKKAAWDLPFGKLRTCRVVSIRRIVRRRAAFSIFAAQGKAFYKALVSRFSRK